MKPPFQAWIDRARSVPIEHELERRGVKLRGNGHERAGPCPKCGGDDRSSINTAKQVFHCRGCDVGGDVIKLVEHLDGCNFKLACTTLAGEPPPKANGKDRTAEPKRIVVAEFTYEKEDGSVAFAVERIQCQNADGSFVLKDGKTDKTFVQKRPDPDRPGRWIYKITDEKGNLLVPIVPYRLPQLVEAIANKQTVAVVEGEAKVDLLRSGNVPATCCAMGAGKWRAEHSHFLRGADVVLIPDNDDAGYKHVQEVGTALHEVAKRVRVLMLPDLPPKGDVIDWFAASGTREELEALISQAPDWQPLIPAARETAASETAKASERPGGASVVEVAVEFPRRTSIPIGEAKFDATLYRGPSWSSSWSTAKARLPPRLRSACAASWCRGRISLDAQHI
jgi:DNA primase